MQEGSGTFCASKALDVMEMEWNGLILLKKTRFEQRSWYNISKGESDFSREEFMVRVPWSSTFQKIQLQVKNLNPIRFTVRI